MKSQLDMNFDIKNMKMIISTSIKILKSPKITDLGFQYQHCAYLIV